MGIRKKFRDCNFVVIVLALIFASIMFVKTVYVQDDVIRVDTNLVTVHVTVLDRDGRYVTNLKKEDFQIFEDEIEQEIDYFETVEQPFTVMLLLDNSGSMKFFIPQLVNAVNTFVQQLRPDDKLSVVTFSSGGMVNRLFKPTKVAELKTRIKIEHRVGEGTTTTFDAVDYALKKMKEIKGRKAIVLFSDGELYGLYSSAKNNLRDAEEGESLIYTVKFGSYPYTHPSIRNDEKKYSNFTREVDQYLNGLAEKTGGRPFQVNKINNLEETFKMVVEELGRQYSLGFYVKETEKKKKLPQIKVKVRKTNLVLRTRSSYVVESN
jgi:Ca-activated chloride channel family protein